jgi:hypothetical protein
MNPKKTIIPWLSSYGADIDKLIISGVRDNKRGQVQLLARVEGVKGVGGSIF